MRPGMPCVILLDSREGEPDRTGAAAVFEGFFDFETGDPRRSGAGIPRLRVGEERLWGFECWWRLDPQRAGLTADDREQLACGLKEALQAARERRFAVSSMPHRGLCETCPGRGGLCSWSEAETLRPQPPSEGSKTR